MVGEFVLSIQDEESATDLSNTIAEKMGLPSSNQFDEMAKEVLFEFWNTVVGQAIMAWDVMSISVQFETPLTRTDHDSNKDGSTPSGEPYYISVQYGNKELVVTVVFL